MSDEAKNGLMCATIVANVVIHSSSLVAIAQRRHHSETFGKVVDGHIIARGIVRKNAYFVDFYIIIHVFLKVSCYVFVASASFFLVNAA